MDAIVVENVSKSYQVWDSPASRVTAPLADRLGRWIGGGLGSSLRASWGIAKKCKEFQALQPVTFSVARGESLGIIGTNGSGKSTLLQIIAGTLTPTTGRVVAAGRIAALLELGSGFNPEFTGRENVYLNGAILGLSRAEIEQRFDNIAGFADIGPYLEEPVKTYSSGMVVRLAFAVQVQLSPDILIVDEALAVGDSLFQKRCFQKMEQLISNGTTLIFVSHDIESVRTLTSRALLLDGGRPRALGPSSEVVLEYRRLLHEKESRQFQAATQRLMEAAAAVRSSTIKTKSEVLEFGDLDAKITRVRLLDSAGNPATTFMPGEWIRVEMVVVFRVDCERLSFGIRLRNKEGVKVYSWGTRNRDISVWAGLEQGDPIWERKFSGQSSATVEFTFENRLGSNLYEVQCAVDQSESRESATSRMIHWLDEAAFFNVVIDPTRYVFNGVVDLKASASVARILG